MPSPPGIRVPHGGSSCAKCMYIVPGMPLCANKSYIAAAFSKGKKSGDPRFIDGKTGDVITNPLDYCCNFFDWVPTSSLRVKRIASTSGDWMKIPKPRVTHVELIRTRR